MQCLEVSGAVRPIYESLGVKRLKKKNFTFSDYEEKRESGGITPLILNIGIRRVKWSA